MAGNRRTLELSERKSESLNASFYTCLEEAIHVVIHCNKNQEKWREYNWSIQKIEKVIAYHPFVVLTLDGYRCCFFPSSDIYTEYVIIFFINPTWFPRYEFQSSQEDFTMQIAC